MIGYDIQSFPWIGKPLTRKPVKVGKCKVVPENEAGEKSYTGLAKKN